MSHNKTLGLSHRNPITDALCYSVLHQVARGEEPADLSDPKVAEEIIARVTGKQ